MSGEEADYMADGGYNPTDMTYPDIDPDACTACDQSGICQECDGPGEVCHDRAWGPCEPCGGTGDCPTCEGEGTMRPHG